MTVNTECGLLLTYVPTYRNARASEGSRYRACTVSACKQRWPPSSGSHIQLTPRMHADTRRRVARVRSPVSQPPAQVQGSSGSSSGASSGPQARAQGLRPSGASSGSQLALQLFPGAARSASHRGRINPRVCCRPPYFRLRPKLTCASPPPVLLTLPHNYPLPKTTYTHPTAHTILVASLHS